MKYDKLLFNERCRVEKLGWHPIPLEQKCPSGDLMYCFKSIDAYCGTRATEYVYAKNVFQALRQIDERPLYPTKNRSGC